MVPHRHLTHHYWDKEVTLPKLPLLHREEMSRRDRHNNSEHHPWQPSDSVHRRCHTLLEEHSPYVPSPRASDVDKVFPLKPVLHKRAYSLSNYQINNVPVYPERFYSCLPRLTDVRQLQTSVRKPEVPQSSHHRTAGRHKPTKSDLEGEHKISEKLSKEIQSREMVLQERFYKAGETLRRIRREKTARPDGVIRDKRTERCLENEKLKNRLYSDWNEVPDRYEHASRESDDDMDRWEQWEHKVIEKEKQRKTQLLTSERTKLKDKIERDGYENTVNGKRGEKMSENGMGRDTRDRSGRRQVEDLRREKYDRRRDLHIREDEEEREMRKLGSSERSHLKQDGLKNVPYSERREHELMSGGRRRKSPDGISSERGKHLQQVELSPEDNPQELVACDVCQRCFLPNRLETHIKICEKKRPQRKIFDMSQHRAKGTDLEEFLKTNSRTKMTEEVKKRNMWRQKHEAFIQIMRQGRTQEPQSALNLNPEYISCPHCGRRFAPGPAERHIPKCQNIRSRPPPPPKQLHNATRKKH